MEDKVLRLIEDIKKKAELDARYYTGAIEGLNLLLSQLKPEQELVNEQPEEPVKPTRKGNKPS